MYRYRLVNRCIPGGKQYDWYVKRAQETGEIYQNDWQLYNEYRTESACKGQMTRLVNYHLYDGEIEWRMQRQLINPDWEFI